MTDPVLILSIVSGLLALGGLARAAWHVWRYECRMHRRPGGKR